MRLIPIALMATCVNVQASTWLDEGSVVAMDRTLAKELASSRLCASVPDDEVIAVLDSGQSIFTIDSDGQITVLKNMFAERIWLDHCQ